MAELSLQSSTLAGMSLLRNALKGSTAPSGLVSIERPIKQSDPELPDWVMSSVLTFLEPFFRGEGPRRRRGHICPKPSWRLRS